MKKMFIAISLLFSLTITSSNAVEVSVEAKITGLYVAYFNRAADQAGLKYWTDKADEVAKQGDDVSSVFKTLSAGFATHPTFKSTYEHLENKAFVEAIYRNALGRDGDAEGIGYWTDLLDRVIMNRPDMVATFVELSMVKDLTKENFPNLTDEELAAAQLRQDLITNKVNASLAFTRQLGILSNVKNSEDPEKDPSYIASILIVSEVTEDKKTVITVNKFLEYILNVNDQIAFMYPLEFISAPFAKAGTDTLIHEDQTASFNGSKSLDLNGNIVRYAWSEGSNVLGVGMTLTGITLSPGVHTITLTVTDDDGKVSADTMNVEVNKLPVVAIEGNITNVWGVDAKFDGSKSSDPDGDLVNFAWSNSEETKTAIYTDLPLGDNKISLTVTDDDGGTSKGEFAVKTLMCANQTNINLLDEVNGDVNTEPNTNHVSCYKIHLSSNNATEKYALYMNLYEGTKAHTSVDMAVKLKDASGVLIKTFTTGTMDATGDRMYQQFDIIADGDYYLTVYRKSGYAAKYGFSIQPSLSNGLVQDTEGELNDFPSMATPLTLVEAQSDVDGTLNITRAEDSSIKNSDQYDYYEINFDKTGTFTFYMNLYEGTKAHSSVDMVVELKNDSGELIKTFTTATMDAAGDRMYQQFDIPTEGKYYLKLYRRLGYAAKYGFSIQPSLSNGLVQDTEGELNDFPSMATPLTLVEAQSDVDGTLNITRAEDSSIKNSDQYDYYEINFDKTGTFTFYMNLYEGTKAHSSVDMVVELKNDSGELIKTFTTATMDAAGDSMNEEFDIETEGKYYLKLYRRLGYAADYGYKITQP